MRRTATTAFASAFLGLLLLGGGGLPGAWAGSPPPHPQLSFCNDVFYNRGSGIAELPVARDVCSDVDIGTEPGKCVVRAARCTVNGEDHHRPAALKFAPGCIDSRTWVGWWSYRDKLSLVNRTC